MKKKFLFSVFMICAFIMACCIDSPESSDVLFWSATIIGLTTGLYYIWKYCTND